MQKFRNMGLVRDIENRFLRVREFVRCPALIYQLEGGRIEVEVFKALGFLLSEMYPAVFDVPPFERPDVGGAEAGETVYIFEGVFPSRCPQEAFEFLFVLQNLFKVFSKIDSLFKSL